MKNHLDHVFSNLKTQKKKALIAYLTAGYPRFSQQTRLIQSMEKAGVDVLEIGIPFSDPIADGPTIQFSSQKSLDKGTSLTQIIKWVGRLRKRVSMPFVIMSYLNPILAYGFKKFAKEAKKVGISGVIIPDLIVEEAREVENALKNQGIHMIFLITPTTPRSRQKLIARRTGGFLYAVSITGVTGARKSYTPQTRRWLSQLQGMTTHPVCVGFGISGRPQIRQLKKHVDGFIVGSAFIDLIRKNTNSSREKKLKQFATGLAKECFYGR